MTLPANELPAPPTQLDHIVRTITITVVSAVILLLVWAIRQGFR